MAKINKMLIQGIRSFSPDEDEKQMIHFQTPLTLILGHNGCGKTTIIESLKYAITGEMPPGCRQGHAFIYDPKLARMPEVRAKVQLKLTDVKGKELVVTRAAQVTQKKGSVTFKTLDTTISRKGPDGAVVQTSGRCVDIDTEVCSSMGITKALINSVILCHQEETSWPLDEGKKLKERFDAIFDTDKHNKCLKQIKEVKDNATKEVNILNVELKHLEHKKDAAERLEGELQDTERRIEVAQDQIDKFKVRCEPLDCRLNEIRMQESNIVTLFTKQENLNTQIKSLQQQQRELKETITEVFEGTCEDLKDSIESFQSQNTKKEAEYRDLLGRLERSRKEEQRISDDMSQQQKKIGQLEAECQLHQKSVQERNKNLEKLMKEFEIKDQRRPDESNIQEFLEKADSKVQEKKAEFQQLRKELLDEEQNQQSQLDKAREEKIKLDQEIKSQENQIQSTQSEIRQVNSDIKEVERSTSRLAALERELSDVRSKIDQLEIEVNVTEEREDIERLEEDEKRVNEELEGIYKEVQQLQLHSTVQSQLSLLLEQKTSKTTEYNRLKNKNGESLKHLLKTLPSTGIKKELQICLDNITQEINDKNREIKKIHNEVAKLEMDRSHKKELLQNKEKELKEDEEKIYEICEDQNFENVILNLKDKIQEMRDLKGMLTSQNTLYKKYIRKLQENDPCCPLCHRNFDHKDEAVTLIDELNSEVRNVPTRLRDNDEKLEKNVKEYDALLQLKPTYERINNFKEHLIPKLRKELKDVENKLKKSRETAEMLENDLMSPQTDEGIAKSLQGDVVLMDQCQAETKRLETEISRLEEKLPVGVSTRTLDEAMNLQESLRKEVSSLQQLAKTRKRKLDDHLNKIQQLKDRKNKLGEEQLNVHSGAQQLRQKQERLIELESVLVLIEEKLEYQRADMATANKIFEDTNRALTDMRRRNHNHIEKEDNLVTQMRRQYEEVNRLHGKVLEYEKRGLNGKLSDAQKTLEDMEKEKKALRTRQKDLTERTDLLKNDVNRQKERLRELQDNLKLMEKQETEKQLKQEVSALTTRIGGLKYNEVQAEKKKIEAERDTIIKEAQQAEGRMDELKKLLVSQRRELSQDMYQNAAKKYSNTLREKIVKEIAADDLLKYYKAMDWAMMHFHQERMKIINEIIHDLWRSVYRGNDIDYIKIVAEHSETPSANKQRRSYNYQVVQVKNDAEIEMRTRCSAGQKVLACLIIRIALAETLSSHCGILALDEPTTNLDRENIGSLAEALVQLVNSRMVNKSFQLLVITHDEEFVQHMKRVDELSYYFVISRNEEGKSQIRKHAVDFH